MFIDFPAIPLNLEGLERVRIPAMVTVSQRFDAAAIDDVAEHLRREMSTVDAATFRGKSVCVTVGSRGIPHLAAMTRAICDILKGWGAHPFIVPSMGSHGGATAKGQLAVLHDYGVTEESVGVPIHSSMEVVQYGELDDGTPLFCDKHAWEADGIVVCNKVKPHTDFRGEHESGLAKMIAIGLAKHKGAALFHMKGMPCFGTEIPKVCRVFLTRKPLVLGVGVVQNAYDAISDLAVCTGENLLATDAALLRTAKAKMPHFKFASCDVLIIDEIGKNISGGGHDPNISGRTCEEGFATSFRAGNLFIRGLSDASHGNGLGLHVADITTRRCMHSVNWQDTWINAVTSNRLNGCRMPAYAENDREALRLAIRACDNVNLENARVARIQNTLRLDTIQVSEALYKEIADHPDIRHIAGPEPVRFDAEGFMLPFGA